MKEIKTFDEYMSGFPDEIRVILMSLRKTILDNAPDAVESITYGMPAYKLKKKPLVYFGCFEKHIGFYATPTGHEKFKDKLSAYRQGKGSVRFPLDKPLPLDLIAEIVRFRVEENSQK